MNGLEERTPRWIWAVMAALAAIQPALLLWITCAAPAGMVPTGLPIADSALFLYAMRMPDHRLASLYATCASPFGMHSLAYWSVPHLWLYAVLGVVARLLHVSDIVLYALANGAAAFLFLYAAYRFLKAAVPRLASRAFALFALSGGLGGILFIISGLLGAHGMTGFEDVFRRFAVYELFEGPHLLPVLLFPRCYYTLSLALCLFALARVSGGAKRSWPIIPMLALGSFIDLRYGVFAAGIALLFVLLHRTDEYPALFRRWLSLPAGLALGGVPAMLLMRQNPAVIQNHYDITNMAMWLSPFIATAFFHLLLLPGSLRRTIPAMSVLGRTLSLGAIGYLAAFALLFCAYQMYYGNLLVAHDAAVATAISDYALVGFVAGLLLAALWPAAAPLPGAAGTREQWLALWLLACLPLALSAFGSGWFLRYGPQRIEVFLWLPLCAMSAVALEHMGPPVVRRFFAALMITCGLCSIAVSALFFQGPLALRPHESPYAALHTEVMTAADASLIDTIGAGIVLAPIPASDIVALRRGNRVVFGTGSFNLSDRPYAPLEAQAKAFFSPTATDDDRRAFINTWCVDYIYCPDTWPVSPEVLRQLGNVSWIEKIAESGHGAVFRVPQRQFTVAREGVTPDNTETAPGAIARHRTGCVCACSR